MQCDSFKTDSHHSTDSRHLPSREAASQTLGTEKRIPEKARGREFVSILIDRSRLRVVMAKREPEVDYRWNSNALVTQHILDGSNRLFD